MTFDCFHIDIERSEPADSVAAALLAQAPIEELPGVIDAFIGRGRRYDAVLLEACLAEIDQRGDLDSPDLISRLTAESRWRESETGLWLVARLLELTGQTDHALAAWDQIIAGRVGATADAHLSRARILSRTVRVDDAYADLRQAIALGTDYPFFMKASKLLERIRRMGPPAVSRGTRIALLSSTTTDLIVPVLKAVCLRDDIDAEVYQAPYGNWRQEILNPGSALYAFEPDFVLIATNWRDANLPALSDAPEEDIERVVGEYRRTWEALLRNRACRIIQHNFEVPADDSCGHLSWAHPGGRARMLREINLALMLGAPSAVAVLDLDQVAAKYGKRDWFDASYWHTAKQYPAAGAVPMLADHQVALIRAGLGLSKKVLVLDLDNTLWGGVIGEDGLEGIKLGPPSAVGEAHQAFQRYVLELRDRGIVLAVCSKNNEEDARLPFVKHDSTLLRLEDFVVFKANWRDKPANLREIASSLNVGIDSLVFVDDSPIERAIVRRELPQVAVPEIGRDPAGFVSELDRYRYFEALTLSREDRERHESYRANAVRHEMMTSATSLEEFLRELGMEAETGPFNELVLDRVVQLIGKTNQFNLTSRRYSEEEVRQIMASSSHWTRYFKMADRFGDNGLIGVMVARVSAEDTSVWEIDTWLMSCRVIGRQMENLMLHTLVEDARSGGARELHGTYVPTAKNEIVAELYPKMGFARLRQTPDGATDYVLNLARASVSRGCIEIRNQNTSLSAGHCV